uniref:uncharacterized protein LOC120340855 n=1 Tax=Styela clava TaxID=7725 RepID=UPI0019393A2C|nr:uncharacterized protein LOC120340855 [Styela clava]
MRSVALPTKRKLLIKPGEVNPTRPVARKRRERIRKAMDNKKKMTEFKEVKSEDKYLVQIGDRVRVAKRYTGTVKFIGRLETEVVFPEVFVGVHLDEQVTKNSGVFHNRQYFDCPYGYGIMVPYGEVRKLRGECEVPPITKNDFIKKSKKKTKHTVPYSIKRWKSSVDIGIPDIIHEPIIKQEKPIRRKKTKESRIRPKKLPAYPRSPPPKFHVTKKTKPFRDPPPMQFQPTKKEFPVASSQSMTSKIGDHAPPSGRVVSRFMPDPYPSRSALQQSFAMITDSAYSSADSGYSEYVAWREQNNKKIQDFLLGPPVNPAKSNHQDWDLSPRGFSRAHTGTWSSLDTSRNKSWPRNLEAPRNISQSRRVICAPASSFDPDDYEDGYYKRGKHGQERQHGITYMNNEYQSMLTRAYKDAYSTKETDKHDSYHSELYKKNRGVNHEIKRISSQSLSSSCSESENSSFEENDVAARDHSLRNLEQISPTGTATGQQRGMSRARSYNDMVSKTPTCVSKRELKQWRKKFGEVEASHMVTGLQKLQDAFAKGMNLTDTYGFPTAQGRYVRAGK